jgi:hypothetical protein
MLLKIVYVLACRKLGLVVVRSAATGRERPNFW